jgi:hypothetical protein
VFAEDGVLLHVAIDVSLESRAATTGYSLHNWNALSDDERLQVAKDVWDDLIATFAAGGVHVVTAGARQLIGDVPRVPSPPPTSG